MERQLKEAYHHTIGNIVSIARNARARVLLRKLGGGEYFTSHYPPFISQLADADKSLIEGYAGIIRDEQARLRFGAESAEEFSYWAWRACGVVCVEMAVAGAHRERLRKTTMDFIRDGVKIGGYNDSVGWYHRSLIEMARQHNLPGRIDKYAPPSDVALKIAQDNFVLASVKNGSTGHLVLLHGAKVSGDGKVESFVAHDPMDFYENGRFKVISQETFAEKSNKRVISLNPNSHDPKVFK